MFIRRYQSGDCRELAELFYNTVHGVNCRDYTKEQLDAWACGLVDMETWNRSFEEHFTVIAQAEGRITGFGDMSADGYLDRLTCTGIIREKGLRPPCADAWSNGYAGREREKGNLWSQPMRPLQPDPFLRKEDIMW